MTWSPFDVTAVWNKGMLVKGAQSSNWRKDKWGAWIAYDKHGQHNSMYGWDIVHINPKAQKGKNDISNLQPLQWKNNDTGRLHAVEGAVTAKGNANAST